MGEAEVALHPLLVLWDIDHTLIENNGVNKEVYARTFELLTDRAAEYPAETEGRTEPEIMRNMFLRHGIEPTADHIRQMPVALEAATSAKAETLRQRGHELPGARNALAELQATPGVIQSVLSGNIRPNAQMKLSAFGLDSYIDFEVGGYGSDDEVRDNLVRIARERACAKYVVNLDKTTTILIGDTPRDVQAGRNGGAYVIGVASGSDSAEILRDEGADVVLPDLRDTRAILDAINHLQC